MIPHPTGARRPGADMTTETRTKAIPAHVTAVVDAYTAQVIARTRGDGYSAAAHQQAAVALDEMLVRLCADSAAMDVLADWFSNGDDLVLQHDEPDHSDHVRTREVTVYDAQGRHPWRLSVLLVKNAYGEDDPRNESLRAALAALSAVEGAR
jgi:hypothetical protein